jgi:hypothetical protein
MQPINLEHLRRLAHSAHSDTSFSPERRAEAIIKDYTEELNGDRQTIEEAAPADFPIEEKEAIQTRYRLKYESLLSAWLQSRTGLASAFVTGPSNFPAARMEKRSRWADNHYEHFRTWRLRALKAIVKGLKPKGDELENTRQKLQNRLRWQRIMVAANKIIRNRNPDMKDKLTGLGYTAGQIEQLLTPDWADRRGFKPYQLSNNGAEVRRLRQRVARLEEKKKQAETIGTTSEEIKGVLLVQNYEADRVQLLFPAKPERDMIALFKQNGFKWAPSAGAWQRKLTPQAVYIARQLLQKL